MKKHILIPFVSLVFLACGGGGGSSDSPTNTQGDSTIQDSTNNNLKIAVSNIGNNIEHTFNEFTIRVSTSKDLTEEQKTSQSTIAVYGTINGNATNALLKINTNYVGSEITIYVYKDSVLVGQSQTISVENFSAINFGEITTN